MVNNVINFAMNVFAVYMLEKMSRAKWSVKHEATKEAKQTTQMDREVAAGFFDYKMVGKSFWFSNYTHNIPRHDSSLDSERSSNVETPLPYSRNSSINDAVDLPITLERSSRFSPED